MTSRAGGSPIVSSSSGLRPTLVLASSSPRRLELLRQVMIEPDRIVVPDLDEAVLPAELPMAYALRLATAKAQIVQARLSSEAVWILAADTVVACGRRILGKAEDAGEAGRFLDLLSGRRHRVHTGVCVVAPDGRNSSRVVTTMVAVKRLSREERAFYLTSGEWRGKAGAYAIQGLAAGLIPAINGSYSNVVGLPLAETLAMLTGLGWSRA